MKMNWLSQFSLVMRSSISSLKEMVEDPERMLHQLIIDMQNELEEVRASVAEAVADEIQMRKRAESERAEAEKWLERATAALKRKDETSARSALDQKLAAQTRADQYANEYEKQRAEVNKLQKSVRDLEDKIRQARQKKTLLTARMARAASVQKIHSAMDRCHSQSAFAQFSRLEGKVDRQEALCEAWDRMDGKDPAAEELEERFEIEERQEQLSIELEKLKSQVE